MDEEDLENRFTYHSPKGDQGLRYEMIRDRAHNFAMFINEHTPDSREKSLAITHLENAVMWANAAIARNELWLNLKPQTTANTESRLAPRRRSSNFTTS